ncbi:LPS export ABC transporter periplasmic protein LptC [Aestuariirhabdus litorea]|uniref:LPS export ABC transporter periplasmic protein LptC n=1 Tax=Aestuariirhabdus litorea TaxID=2528527 RepID=UPI0013E2BB98|nr:LPS export ABC transporter periplasmic protein LptC [Aestuariirhabdus litorea]
MRAALISLLVSALLAYGGFYLYQNTPLRQALTPPDTDPSERQEADFYLTNARLVRFNQQGELDHRMHAQEVNHYPLDDTTIIRQPRMVLYREQGERHISASNGKLLPGSKDLELWDEVLIVARARDGSEQGRLDTDFITLYSGQELASTSRPVIITTPQSVTRAVGLNAHLDQNRVQLLSNVRGTYEVQ